ncbi:MAG: Photosystem II manganese-stabilizing polypeptide [Moorea sp. SIO3G5]|nr:Photosystem II manganese-stabilizing polypeptide [Moorena sp. SIO3G5]
MKYRALICAFLALCLGVFTASCSPDIASLESIEGLTYDQIKNTGLANNCPQLSEMTRGAIPVDPDQSYEIVDMCVQPTTFFVKEEGTKRKEAEYVPGKLLTRYTSSLVQVRGDLVFQKDGSLKFLEKDGIDFQPITIQLPGGEQVPFLFTIKKLVATTEPGLESINASTDFVGDFYVPSYRGAVFLDPKGRGLASGYDNSVALPSQADSQEFANVKSADVGEGTIELRIAQVDRESGEIAGTFISEQPSDTDLGADEPEEVKVQGIFYGRIQPKQA